MSEPERHDKVWGHELWLTNTPNYCCKALHLRRGYRCSLHYHEEKDETFYVASGRVLMEIGSAVTGEARVVSCTEMGPGDHVRIAPYTLHRFSGIEDSVILEASTHHDEADSCRIELSGPIPLEHVQV